MSEMMTLSEMVARYKAAAEAVPARRFVENWREMLPPGSRWQPGLPGRPDCPVCHGFGYVRSDWPLGHPLMGKVGLCDCAKGGANLALVARYSERCGLTADELRLRWTGMRMVHNDVQNAVAGVKGRMVNRQGWLYLWGGPGQGKSRMLKTAVAESISLGVQAVYMTHADLLEYLRGGYSADQKDQSSDGEYDARVEYLRGLPLLAIDEFQRARQTEWAKEADARVLDARYQRAGECVTLFAANFGPREYSNWFASRLAQFQPGELHLMAGDFRSQ